MLGRCVCFVFAVVLVSSPALIGADTPDPFSVEPFATFMEKLNAFSAQPTVPALRDLENSTARLPVRDLQPGQIGEGHPLDCDTKLRCLLRFVAAMDRLVKDHLPTAYVNVGIEGVPVAGMNPGDVQDPIVRAKYIAAINENAANILIVNFQTRLRQTRDVMVRLRIPRFFEYECRGVPANHLQQIIGEELKDDLRAKEAIASLSQAVNAR